MRHLRETPRAKRWWLAGFLAAVTLPVYVPLLWGSDLLLRNGRTVSFVIAVLLVFAYLWLHDGGVPQRVKPRAKGEPPPPPRHRAP